MTAKPPIRRRPPRWRWLWPGLKAAAALALVAGIGAGGLHAWRAVIGSDPGARALSLSASLGLAVQEVLVEGRRRTPAEAVLQALAVERGTPILQVDPAATRERLEALSWVRLAQVERRLPDLLHVRLVEREPLALWQQGGRHALIDAEGVVLTSEGLEDYAHLVVVVGEGAPARAAGLMRLLAQAPDLKPRVRYAQWVGERRWNLVMDNGITVRLPEGDAAAAWLRLAELEREHSLLEREVLAIDLRLPDRLIVQVPHEPKAPAVKPKGPQKNT
ncbi:MAG: hypothetical protein OHK0024_29470 [Thalassobaculales bacterium]